MAADSESERREQRLMLVLQNCPCDACPYQSLCGDTGMECRRFHKWVATGKPQPPTQHRRNT